MRTLPVLLGLSAASLLAGCQCRPSVPNPPDTEPDDTAKVDTAPPAHTGETGATAPQGPCTLDELEPNNLPDEAYALPTDQYLCGAFGQPADFDYYDVALPADGWLGIYVDAQLRGSLADVTVTVTSDVGVSAERDNDDQSRDVHLVFPASAGSYSVLLLDGNLNGGADFGYELVASVAKKPIAETAAEVEPNGDSATAMPVTDGMVLLGGFGAAGDADWYRIAIPAGAHDVTLDVDAYSLGSPVNPNLVIYDKGLDKDPTKEVKGLAGELDAATTWRSDGDETVWFRVEEADGKGGPAWWYALKVTVEEQ